MLVALANAVGTHPLREAAHVGAIGHAMRIRKRGRECSVVPVALVFDFGRNVGQVDQREKVRVDVPGAATGCRRDLAQKRLRRGATLVWGSLPCAGGRAAWRPPQNQDAQVVVTEALETLRHPR